MSRRLAGGLGGSTGFAARVVGVHETITLLPAMGRQGFSPSRRADLSRAFCFLAKRDHNGSRGIQPTVHAAPSPRRRATLEQGDAFKRRSATRVKGKAWAALVRPFPPRRKQTLPPRKWSAYLRAPGPMECGLTNPARAGRQQR